MTSFDPSKLLAGRTAFITGAGRGNGRAIALGLSRAGARVVVTDIDAANATETAAAITAAGGTAWAHALDVTQPQACHSLAERITADIGPIDLLVNNAGVLFRGGIDGPDAVKNQQTIMKVNYEGTFNVTYAWLPALRQTQGTIVNISSTSSFIGQTNAVGYSPSKGAVKMFTQALAAELGKEGVRVNAVAPGVIATEMSAFTRADPAKLERYMTRIPMQRVGEPDELVGAVLFLSSAMSSYVTGISLPVDGGFLAG